MHLRAVSSITAALLAITASSAGADKPEQKHSKKKAARTTKPGPAPGKGFWKVLVQPGAKWTLYMAGETQPRPNTDYNPEPIVVETYDVRKVGDADVARLRWRLKGSDSTESPLHGTHAPPLDQFAVTSAGLYILTADMDDARIAEALKSKPSRSDPPKAYKGTKLNEGRYLEIRDGMVCLGQGPEPDEPECEDTCSGEVCISATEGIVQLNGNWAPDMFDYMQVRPAKHK